MLSVFLMAHSNLRLAASGRRADIPLMRWLVPAGAAFCLLPIASPAAGLVAGAAIGLTAGNPYLAQTRRWTHRLLALSVIGLGAGMDLRVVAAAGARGFAYTAAGITVCLTIGALLARALRVEAKVGLLISVGTAICGGSAIAALAPALRAREHAVSVALATVFLLNGVALLVFPLVGHGLALDQQQFGAWAALAIHDTSSVVGAGMAYGPEALAVATTMKLARALWIVPVTLVAGAAHARGRDGRAVPAGASPRPWFIAGFLAAAALATWIPALRPFGHHVSTLAGRLMVVTLFLIGAGLSRPALRAVGVRPLLQGVLLWSIMAAGTLACIVPPTGDTLPALRPEGCPCELLPPPLQR